MNRNVKLNNLLSELSYSDQKDMIVVFSHWINQQVLVDIRDGNFDVPADSAAKYTTVPVETVAGLEHAVANDDENGSLKIGVVEIVRSLPLMQRGSTGPKANVFLRRHLSERIFHALYEAAGLDVDALVYDENFPTDPITPE